MAKITEQLIVIKVSKLLKDDEPSHQLVDQETLIGLEAVASELLGDRVIVEVEAQ
jgi:hypothetical protein